MENIHGTSDLAWDKARFALSEEYINPIGARLLEVNALAYYIDSLSAYDFKFVDWEEFLLAEDKPDGILERAMDWREDHPESEKVYVVYDPLDDASAFLLIARDPMELARITCQYIASLEPENGPLSIDKSAMKMVEAS